MHCAYSVTHYDTPVCIDIQAAAAAARATYIITLTCRERSADYGNNYCQHYPVSGDTQSIASTRYLLPLMQLFKTRDVQRPYRLMKIIKLCNSIQK